MIKYILILLVLLVVVSTKSEPLPDVCVLDPLYCQIIKNNPRIKIAYARKLANSIDRISKKYDLNPLKLSAIFMQESTYNVAAINYNSKDYSIGQINIKNIEYYKFDKNRLLNDLDYSVEASAKILNDLKKKHKHKELNWWSRYHSGNKDKRKKYEYLVSRYL